MQSRRILTCGPLQVTSRVTRPQTSYRAALQSFAVNSSLASRNHELTYDNKAVVDHAVHPPHMECSDMDLRLTIQEETQNKPLHSRWVPSHRDIAKAKTKEERTDIKRNDEVDRLAKMATGLPLPEYTPTHPGDIAVNAGLAPLLAKKKGHREETLCFIFRYALGVLAPARRNPPDHMGKMAMGK